MKHWTLIPISVLALSALALVGFTGCGTSGSTISPAPPVTASSIDVRQLVSSEEMILALTKHLGPLNRSAMNLKLPSGNGLSLFADDVLIADIGSKFDTPRVSDYLTLHQWQVQPPGKLLPQGFWSAFISQVAYLEDAKFYLIDGQFSSDRTTFESNMGFSAHARMTGGAVGYASAKMHVIWSWADSQRTRMQITSWETKHFECSISENALFQDVTQRCISDSKVAGAFATSMHENMTRTLILGKPINRPKDDKYPFFFPEVTLEHPAVSVVEDDARKLKQYTERFHPAYNLLEPDERRGRQFTEFVQSQLGTANLPFSVIVSGNGTVIQVMTGLPTLSELRQALSRVRDEPGWATE